MLQMNPFKLTFGENVSEIAETDVSTQVLRGMLSYQTGETLIVSSGTGEIAKAFNARVLAKTRWVIVPRNPAFEAVDLCDLVGRESPFEELEEAKDDAQRLNDLVTFVQRNYSSRLASRLQKIFEAVKEEQLGINFLSVDSLKNFVRFLKQNPLPAPNLVLTSSGNVRAEWKKGPDKFLGLEFLKENDCKFVLFAPDEFAHSKILRVSGWSSIDRILNTIEFYGVNDWMSDEGRSYSGV